MPNRVQVPDSTIVYWSERPKQSATMEYKKPSSSREYAVWGTLNKLDVQLAVMQFTPVFDASVDPTTGNAITLFRGTIKIEEAGGGAWNVTVPYESSQNTVELNFSLGVQSTKIQQSLDTVASFSCIQPASAGTTSQAGLAAAAAAAATTAAADVNAQIASLADVITAAATAAAVPGVAAGVVTAIVNETTAAAQANVDAATVRQSVAQASADANAAADAAQDGDLTGARNAAAAAQADARTATQAALNVLTDAGNVATADAAADAAASGGNAQTLAAASAADALSTAVNTLASLCDTAQAAALSAAQAASAAALGASGDLVPGNNGVPDFNGAIGVNGDQVEGVEIEVGKVEFSINQKYNMAVVPGAYFATLADMTDRTVVNGTAFAFVWYGQTLLFAKGTLRFRGSPIKWTSQKEVDITYHFAYQRSILPSDNFRIGNSAKIFKEGWQYLWVYYKAGVSGTPSVTVMIPQAVYIEQVYPYDDFGKLQIISQ